MKNHSTIFPLALAAGILASLAAAAQTPTVQYRFAGNATDLSGNDRHGLLLGEATIGEGALSITENATGLVQVPESAVNGLGDFTITALVRITPVHATRAPSVALNTILSGASTTDDNALQIAYRNQQGSWQVYLGSPTRCNPAQSFLVPMGRRPLPGKWVHIAYVRQTVEDVTTGTFYQDGVAVGRVFTLTNPLSRARLSVARGGLVIGQDQDVVSGGYEANQSLKGDLAELTIYDGALSAKRVAQLAHVNPSGSALLKTARATTAAPVLIADVYPNPVPAGGTLSLALRGLSGKATVIEATLTDALGRTVRRATVPVREGIAAHELRLGRLPAGTYVLHVLEPATGEVVTRSVSIQ